MMGRAYLLKWNGQASKRHEKLRLYIPSLYCPAKPKPQLSRTAAPIRPGSPELPRA